MEVGPVGHGVLDIGSMVGLAQSGMNPWLYNHTFLFTTFMHPPHAFAPQPSL